MEYIARCRQSECGWAESWDTEQASRSSGVWHVYTAHPTVWRRVIGEARMPMDKPPEQYGRKLESWESQA